MFFPPDHTEDELPTIMYITQQPPHPMDGFGAILTGNRLRIPGFNRRAGMMVFDLDSPLVNSFVDGATGLPSPIHSP